MTKFFLTDEEADKTFSSLVGIQSPSRNKLLEMDDVYMGEDLAVLSNKQLVKKVKDILVYHRFQPHRTKLATSFCNNTDRRVLEKDLCSAFGRTHIAMGGTAGFAFGGLTSFLEMARSSKDCLIVYGPHIGVDETGIVPESSVLGCEAYSKAVKRVLQAYGDSKGSEEKKVQDEEDVEASTAPSPSEVDLYEEGLVDRLLMPFCKRLDESKGDAMELAMVAFDAQDELMQSIVMAGCQQVQVSGQIAMLGGIQVHTPEKTQDYFLPLKFDLLDSKGKLVEHLLWRAESSGNNPNKKRRRRLSHRQPQPSQRRTPQIA